MFDEGEVEAVARALRAFHARHRSHATPWNDMAPDAREVFREEARVAIETIDALRRKSE